MASQDLLTRVYATVQSLRDVVAAESSRVTKGSYADQYNAALDRLIGQGFDVAEFKVPADEIASQRVQTNYVTHEYRMTEPQVDRGLLLAKMNATLTYFDLTTSGTSKVQFKAPRRRA